MPSVHRGCVLPSCTATCAFYVRTVPSREITTGAATKIRERGVRRGDSHLRRGRQLPALLTLVNNFIAGGVLPSWRSRGGISLHLCNDLLFLISGVQVFSWSWRLTSAMTCFSFFRGAGLLFGLETHLCYDLLFLLPGCFPSLRAGDSPLL